MAGAGWGCSCGQAAPGMCLLPPRMRSGLAGEPVVLVVSHIFRLLWRWTPRFLIYSLAASPSSLSLVCPQLPQAGSAGGEVPLQPRCSPERSSSPCQAGQALRGERRPARGQGRHPGPRCPPPLASLRDVTFISVTVGCLESLLHSLMLLW